MTEQTQNLSGGDIADKAGDYAQQHPDQARSVIDKVEDAIDGATGGKYSDAIDKAGDFVEDKLGLPNNQGGEAQADQPSADQPAPTDSASPEEPSEPSAPAEPSEPSAPAEPSSVPGQDEPSEPTVPAEPGTSEVPGSTEGGEDGGSEPTEPQRARVHAGRARSPGPALRARLVGERGRRARRRNLGGAHSGPAAGRPLGARLVGEQPGQQPGRVVRGQQCLVGRRSAAAGAAGPARVTAPPLCNADVWRTGSPCATRNSRPHRGATCVTNVTNEVRVIGFST